MKIRILLVLVMVFFLGLGTGLGAPSLPDDLKIIPPDSSNLSSEAIKFFGNSGQWRGIWCFPARGSYSGENLNVTIIIEELKESGAKGIFSVEGYLSGVTEGWQRFTAKIFKKKGRTLLSFPLSTSSDKYAEAIFWVRGRVLEGERFGQSQFGSPFVTTFALNPL